MGLSLGILGTGSFAQGFIDFFKRHPLVDEITLCDLDAKRMRATGERFGVTRFAADMDDLLAAKLDAVAIFTQPWLHAPQAVAVMESGKHVWSAVPMIMLPGGDEMLDWADRIVATSDRTGQFYMMAETSWFRPGAMFCRRMLDEGRFGQLIHAEAAYLHDYNAPHANLIEVAKRRWGDQWNMSHSGDVPMHYCTHSVGAIMAVVRRPAVKVSCVGRRFENDQWHREDTDSGNIYANETAFVRFDDGMTATVKEYRRIGSENYEGASFYGTDACYIETSESDCVWRRQDASCRPLTAAEIRDPLPEDVARAWNATGGDQSVYGGHGGSHAYLVQEFVDAVHSGRRPAIDARAAARIFAVGIIAHRSACADGQWLDVPDWG